jgi:hypothetical protein
MEDDAAETREIVRVVSYADLPKNDGRYEPAGWWHANEEYGQRTIDESLQFHLLDVSYMGIVDGLMDYTMDNYTCLREDVFEWCKQTLKGWWSPIRVSETWLEFVAFTDPADMVVFKMKWF